MNLLTTRRRGYSKDVERIMTHKTNNLMLTTCYNAGWVRNNRYMTKKEALAVTSIGTTFKNITSGSSRTFKEFKYFTGLTIIGDLAFYGTNKITTLILPSSLKTIGANAFRFCKLTGTLEVPEGVTTIGTGNFYSTSLSKIIIPSTVTSITNNTIDAVPTVKWNSSINPHNPFSSGSSTAHTIRESAFESDVYTVVDSILINGTTIFSVPNRLSNAVNLFPAGTTTIGTGAFKSYTSMISRIPEGITSISGYAFLHANINNGVVILPSSLTHINAGSLEFYNTNLKAVYIPPSCDNLGGFRNSNLAIKVVFINKSTRTSSCDAYAFAKNGSVGKWIVYVPQGAQSTWVNYGSTVFKGYVDVVNIREIPSWFDTTNLDTIEQGMNALLNRESRRISCTYTKQIDTPTTLFSSITNIEEIMINWITLPTVPISYLFQATGTCNISPILIDKTFIEDSMFQNVTAVTSITLNSATVSIGKHSFDGCTALATIDLTNVTTIDDYAFKDCSAITTLNVAKVTTIGEHAFENCTGLTTLTLTAILTIGNSAFTGCTNLDLATIDAIMAINEHAFD